MVISAAVLCIIWPKASPPCLLWNISPSVPTGLYALLARLPPTGALAVIRLPNPFRTLADTRGYLPAGALLIKRIAARPGDIVCRHGVTIAVNGRIVARARTADGADRPLPRWSGCSLLTASRVFVLSPHPDSFDGRYFGPLDRRDVLGTALPMWPASQR
jgi:conjugative transfer signal peptidase TraF